VTEAAGPARPRWVTATRWVVGLAVVVALVVILWNQGQKIINGEGIGWTSYFLVAALVFGDAVCPILPGETTISAACVLASEGRLNIYWVWVAGAIGAVVGDSAVYWIARRATGRLRHWMDKAADNKSATKALDMLDRNGPVFLLFGRYIPGVRFALNATLGGVVKMPYRRFVAWSALSGTIWSAFTCASAYFISNLLDGYPLLSLVATIVASSTIIAFLLWAQKRVQAHRAASVTSPPPD
jgi:membrane-associated protein